MVVDLGSRCSCAVGRAMALQTMQCFLWLVFLCFRLSSDAWEQVYGLPMKSYNSVSTHMSSVPAVYWTILLQQVAKTYWVFLTTTTLPIMFMESRQPVGHKSQFHEGGVHAQGRGGYTFTLILAEEGLCEGAEAYPRRLVPVLAVEADVFCAPDVGLPLALVREPLDCALLYPCYICREVVNGDEAVYGCCEG